ncbi:isopeptide-forming domain-containing fimbrial protein [Microbulbifer sediminum]|uniref:isopeptide-forming domain-containing fimbrial protein n=1 Tax=Microbulbifer sediminum TaxID=2904250 RepID=UPI001F02798D|nr:isopeptide-forming domain-containing fimbrial protein [Microbulbifer sediminum]
MADHNCPVNSPDNPAGFNVVEHRFSQSWCTLCGDGQVTIEINVPSGIRGFNQHIENLVVTENLGASGLEYIPGSTSVSSGLVLGEPTVAGNTLTWDASDLSALASRDEGSSMTITFGVRSRDNLEEDIVTANRFIGAEASFDYCSFPRETDRDIIELDLREPVPQLIKRGRNIDAAQANYTNTVYGNINDDVVWRVNIRNAGDGDMQDVRFDDLMSNPNMDITHVCPTEGAALAIANNNGAGSAPGCEVASNTISDFALDTPFANGGSDANGAAIDVSAGSSLNVYIVGKVNTSCSNGTNTVNDFEWGCEIDGSTGIGGISQTSSGGGPYSATAQMRSVSSGDLTIIRQITGTNTAQPLGTSGYVTLTIRNLTGGSVRDIDFINDLPAEYVVDTSYTPRIIAINRGVGHAGRYAATFAGMVDTLEWRVGSTWNRWESDPLRNNAPEFRLLSSTTNPDYPDQQHMLRHGDEVVIRFRIVTTEPDFFDKVANLDVDEETAGDNTDPNSNITLAEPNTLTASFSDFCTGTTRAQVETDAVTPDPEDLDITTVYPLYIVRDSGTSPLTVDITNNGGHQADDYFVYVSFGQAMTVLGNDRNCSAVGFPPAHPVWNDPDYVPESASVYRCTAEELGVIQPGSTERIIFQVEKNHAATEDDLTFRADLIGEITLSNGTSLDFPDPADLNGDPGTTPSRQQANNYSLDGIRARVLGFNLVKKVRGQCTELNEAGFANEDVIIGEDCRVELQAGGWFGFETPGYTLIEVNNVSFGDDLPDGQGYISDSPLACSDVSLPDVASRCVDLRASNNINELGGLNVELSETDPLWQVDGVVDQRDRWFLNDLTTRILNDPVDSVSTPNQHGAESTDFGRAAFAAVFETEGVQETVVVDNATGVPVDIPGYPPEADWRVDLTVTEPFLEVEKQVCNEALYGLGTGCSNFVDLTDEGHRDQTYIFRLRVTNRAADNGVDRAPAYDLVITDTLDGSGQMCVEGLDADGLDNDGDGVAETIGGDDGLVGLAANQDDYDPAVHCAENGSPAVITFSYNQSAALERLNPGESIDLYYRVKPHPTVAPQQLFTNTFFARYDSLEGDSGNQNVPGIDSDSDNDGLADGTPEIGRARHYRSADAEAQMRIIEVQAQPKAALALSNSAASGSGRDTAVVGEEIHYQLTTQVPAAKLRNFIIRDELPAGMRCVDAPVVDLDAAPYDVAGFIPGGEITPTCTSTGSNDYVEWDFGDQEVTMVSGSLFDFQIEFVARIENSQFTNDGDVLVNGGSGTVADARYIDRAGNLVVVPFAAHEVEILEPAVTLTKSFSVSEADADDVLTVTVTAENTGSATAYNLQVLDDLTDSRLIFLGNIGGADPPENTDTTTVGNNAPIFSWSPASGGYSIPPGERRSFTFDIQVEQDVAPHEILDNTAEGRWQSLPSRNVALNPAGQIGEDGAADGMRIGVLPNAGDVTNDHETTAAAQAEVPQLVLSKSDLSPTVVPTIGAHKQFQVEVRFPEGISESVTLTDQLGTGSASYVLTHNADYDIAYEFVGIDAINGQAPAEAAFNSHPGNNSSGNVTWDIGEVETGSENDTAGNAIEPAIRITYFARVDNEIVSADAGDSLQNSANLTYLDGETGATRNLADNTPVVTAVEPRLVITKTVTNTTGAPGLAQGGDVLEYVVTVTHSESTADAFDLNLVDDLPPEVQLDGSFTPTATVDGNPVAGFEPVPAGAPGGPLNWGRDNGDNSLDLPLGSTLQLTYRATVESVFGQPVVNSVLLDWTSLDDSESNDTVYERHGIGCPITSAPNDYCAGPAEAPLNTEDNTGLEKRVVADSYDDPADSILRVGDTATYQLQVNAQPGTTNAVSVTDVLPAGLTLESFTINGDDTAPYSAGGGYSYTDIPAAAVPAPGATGTLEWNLGDITRELGTATPLVIEYVARVTENNGIPHAASTPLTNTASLTYTDASGNPPASDPRLESSATVTVVQPLLDSLEKIDRDGRSSPYVVMDLANEVMRFQLRACNAGDAPAYGLQLTDDLPMEMDEASIENLDLRIAGISLDPADYSYTAPAARGDDMIFALDTAVDPGQCLEIDYDIGFYPDVGGGQNWINTFTVDEYWSLPPRNAQQYSPVVVPLPYQMNTAPTSVDPLQKILLQPGDGTAVVGEEVVYQLLVPASDSASAIYDLVITDTLDPALEITSVTEISGNGLALDDSNTSGNRLDLRIGLLPAGTQAQIEIRARVANNSTAQAGYSFQNVASYTYAEFDGGPAIDGGAGNSSSLTIIEPALALAKNIGNQTSPGSAPDAGDILRLTLDISEAGGANSADALDLRVSEQLSPGLEYVSGSASFAGAGLADPVVTGDGVAVPQQLTWDPGNSDLDIASGSTAQLFYDVRVTDSVLALADLTSTSRIEWTSLDDDNSGPYERNGTGSPALNDYLIGGELASLPAANDSLLAKNRISDSFNAADSQLRVGDLAEYELRVSLQEGSHPNAVLTDTLPQGMVFAGTLAVNGDTSAPFAAAAPFSHSDIGEPVQSGDPLAGPTTVSWNVADLVNAGDNDAANDEFVIRYRARVLNQDVHPWPANSTPLDNNVDFTRDITGGSDSLTDGETLDLLQPDLAVAVTSSPADGATLAPGDTVDYTATVTNNGSAPAYDLVFRDLIPVGLRQGGVTVQSTSVNGAAAANLAPAYDAATGEVTWDFGEGSGYAIAPGESLQITYRVEADGNLGAGLSIQNGAYAEVYYSLDDDELPVLSGLSVDVDMREDYGPTAPVGIQFNTPSAEDLLIENTQPNASIGEPFAYRVTIPGTGQGAALNDVRVLLDLGASSADLVFVEAVKVSGSANFSPVNTGSATDLVIEDIANGIDVPANETAVIDVIVRLRDSSPPNVDGLAFTNSATYRYNFENDNAAAGQGTGGGNTTAEMTVVEPTALTLDKSGPASVQSGLPGTFVLDVHNAGTGPAWGINITDILPSPDPGGMCETPPENVVAEIVDAGGSPLVSLAPGTDFTTAFDEATCVLTIATAGSNAMVPANHHLRLSYGVFLDADTQDGADLVNVAGVERWYSWDSAAPDAREYTRPAPTDGTPGLLDHEDAFTTVAAVPNVAFAKVVENITRGESPAVTANPGDVLQYTLVLRNLGGLDISEVGITDDLDRLNANARYQAGSLKLVSFPAGADTSNTSAAGGSAGSGMLDLRDLVLGAQGSGADQVEVVYQVSLAPVIDNGTEVLNQARALLPGQEPVDSDDPNVNGTDDPNVAGDEDPTRVVIESAPDLVVEKTSVDISGDADLLLAGDTLRYTLRVRNTGDEDTGEALLRDQVPANTTYVANSTTLNGAAAADVSGSSPLALGMSVASPGSGEGTLLADPTGSGAGEALITFDVIINDVNDGTIISNQGFLNGEGAASGAFEEVPSDDPGTDAPLDPTIDIVGDVPLLVVQKSVAISEDNLTAGIVDPGDSLRYTITVKNIGGVDATEAELTDLIPANTTYVAGSTTLNGIVVSDNVGGEARLATGLPISSRDLTPPLPGVAEGVISSGQAATIVFDVTVDVGTATGTVIRNQGSVATVELPGTLTDADGNPTNGAQPTDVVVGDAQQLSITKEVAVVGGGAAEAGARLEYLVRVTNISAVPASHVVIADDLLTAGEGVLTYVADSALLNGQPAGISVNGSVITADFGATSGDLAAGDSATLRFQADLGAELETGYTVVNTAMVNWNDPALAEQASVTIDVGGTPGIANLAGYLWRDTNFNGQRDAEEPLLPGWTVELYFNDAMQETLQSDEDGFFIFDGLVPNGAGGAGYELRYIAPNAGSNTASLGNADSDFTDGPQQISEIFVASGSSPQDLNLPLTPNGVIYDSVLRVPVSGAVVTMLRASSGAELPDSCFDDPKQQGQVTLSGGYYKFDLNFSSAGCPANADYLIQVEMPGDGYVAGESAIIPPQTNVDTAGFDVAACLGSGADTIPGTADYCEAQASAALPALDIDARSPETDYYLRLTLDDNRIPGESQLFNNHIAIDPQLEGAVSITKTAAMLNVTRSQLVPYTITFSNTTGVPLTDLQLVDFFPAGFKYIAGSARVDGEAIEPEVNGLQLSWSGLRVDPEQTRTAKLLLVVGSGVGEGEYVNRARLFNGLSGQQLSGEASATVRVIPDPTFDCTDVIGKVYDDKNMNGYQDAGEGGVPGARVVTATGLNATTDAHGRFHITCAVVPNQDRGSNFVLKLDDRSLPSGYRLTTENPRVQRATRGKMIKFNFGTSLHRVVRLDLAEAVFEPQTTELRPQWHSRTELLLEKLAEAPSVLRLSYLAENEDPALVERRLQAIKAQVAEAWAAEYGDYELTIETEVFWRRGAPPGKGEGTGGWE